MADLSKLKNRRTTLGAPPPIEEASPNLAAPEIAPAAAPLPEPKAPKIAKAKRGEGRGAPAPVSTHRKKDGRSLRRTNRTVQFATRVSPEFDARIRMIAERDGLLLVEVMEEALDAYEARAET
jgi:hypothetical protein